MIKRKDILARHATLTGSVAFGVAGHRSDEDWLIESIDASEFCNVPWKVSAYVPGEYGFLSYREGKYNLVIYDTLTFKLNWMKAHEHCKIERPRDKKRRIKIFRHYLYGELLH